MAKEIEKTSAIKKILEDNVTTLVDNSEIWIRGIDPEDIEDTAREIVEKLNDLSDLEED